MTPQAMCPFTHCLRAAQYLGDEGFTAKSLVNFGRAQ